MHERDERACLLFVRQVGVRVHGARCWSLKTKAGAPSAESKVRTSAHPHRKSTSHTRIYTHTHTHKHTQEPAELRSLWGLYIPHFWFSDCAVSDLRLGLLTNGHFPRQTPTMVILSPLGSTSSSSSGAEWEAATRRKVERRGAILSVMPGLCMVQVSCRHEKVYN